MHVRPLYDIDKKDIIKQVWQVVVLHKKYGKPLYHINNNVWQAIVSYKSQSMAGYFVI